MQLIDYGSRDSLAILNNVQVPQSPGVYIWFARAPDGGDRFALFVGKAQNSLRGRISDYINADGTFGPKDEKKKLKILQDLLSRGFEIGAMCAPHP